MQINFSKVPWFHEWVRYVDEKNEYGFYYKLKDGAPDWVKKEFEKLMKSMQM